MSSDKTSPDSKAPKLDPDVACVVLVSGTRFGSVRKGKNAKINLPISKAKALAELPTPFVRIEGI